MSSILEALKKLEEEKAARRGNAGNIAGKITSTSRRTRQRPIWLVPAGMAAVAVAAILITYAVMGGFSPRHGGTASGKGTEPASPPLTIPAPQTATADGVKSAAPQTWLSVPGPQGASTGTVTRHASPVPGQPGKQSSPPPIIQHEALPEEAAAPPRPFTGAPFPELNVSGIAWQKDSASRLAVVNGISVTEGAMVKGARVKEILPDRVLFSFNSKEFEVSLEKVAQ